MAVLGLLLLAGCGSPVRHTSAPTTTLIQSDHWTAPALTGGPSAAAFCRVLTAMYRHEARMPLATTRVKEKMVEDFVHTVPEAVAAAPASIAPAAEKYLTSLASVLNSLVEAGLDYKKVPAGTLTPLLLDPSIKAAGNQVLSYSTAVCHYTIGGAPTQP